MKLLITRDWIENRLIFLGIAAAGLILLNDSALPIVLFILIIQRSGHEFIHGLFVKIAGGEIFEIVLGPRHIQYIDFTTTSEIKDKLVYFSGFAFDLICIAMSGIILLEQDNALFRIIGYGLICILIFYHVVPEESDFNLFRKQNDKKYIPTNHNK